MERLRIIVGGFLGLMPSGGVAWDYLQYPVGLALLGHDVHYVEDTQVWPVFQNHGDGTFDCTANVSYLAGVMEAFGLGGRWAYRDQVSGECFGLSLMAVRELCRTADLFINVSCATPLRDEYRSIPRRVLIDSDPMFTQIQYLSGQAFTDGESGMRDLLQGHTHLFTFGENIGACDCRVPDCGFTWQTTRQPICLSLWPVTPPPAGKRAAYTTIMNWMAGRPLVFEGETWGQKDREFGRFMTMPSKLPGLPLAIAVGQSTGIRFPLQSIRRQGWSVLDGNKCTANWRDYQRFIQHSRGEFSVAKETYVKGRTGWFSCRSACYLASGRPVVAQDTGWSRNLPAGGGLFAFDDEPSAVEALMTIAADPIGHGRAARAIAEEYFDSSRVLGDLLAQAGA